MLIKNNGKYVILTGDACYKSVTTGKMGSCRHYGRCQKSEKSVEWVAKMSKSPNCVEILATYDDAEVVPHLIDL